MCGISFIVGSIGVSDETCTEQQAEGSEQHLQQHQQRQQPIGTAAAGSLTHARAMLGRRGPDSYGEHQALLTSSTGQRLRLQFAASLLQLRGTAAASVPLLDPGSRDCLCFNGEIFGGLHVPPGCNDGQVLLQALIQAPDVAALLSRLRGPWSVVYWRQRSGQVWFGRDFMGRRSLLIHCPLSGDGAEQLMLTSVVPAPGPPAQDHPLAAGGSSGDGAAQQPLPPGGPEGASRRHATACSSMHHTSSSCEDATPGSSSSVAAGSSRLKERGAGEDQEDEEGEGEDLEAFWRELPPGIYSLQLKPSTRAQGPGSTAEATGGVTPGREDSSIHRQEDAAPPAKGEGLVQSFCNHGSASCSSAGGSGEAGKAAAGPQQQAWPPSMDAWLLAHGMSLHTHAWADPLIARLHAYDKAAGGAGSDEQRSRADTSRAAAPGPASGQLLPPPPAAPSPALSPTSRRAGQDEDGHPGDRGKLNSSCQAAARLNGVDAAPGAAQEVAEAFTSEAQGLWCAAACDSSLPSLDSLMLCDALRPVVAAWDLHSAVDSLLLVMQAAVDVRCKSLDSAATTARASPSLPPAPAVLPDLQPSVMILFSGGVDSVLLAALAHRSLPPHCPIDLCNVCFDYGRSPDRLGARSALEELAAWAPQRRWRLIQVDSTLQDTYTHRGHLLTLLHPAGTVMDLNIGAALWLAASGQGRLHLPAGGPECAAAAPTAAADPQDADVPMYCSRARVVLLGHGADEQCAGYGRHRTRFRHGGPAALCAELSLDMRRMWRRNCGRDDRLVADRGREARHPFLDERLIGLLLDLPLQCIAELKQVPGVGDKKILRQALLRLGLPEASARVKRAIQFGSRIGKLSNRLEFGSNRAANKVNAGSLALSSLPKSKAPPQ